MANKAAGEITLTLDGREYTLRPSFAAVMEFEGKAGVSVFEAMRDVGEKQSMPLKSVAAAFHSCIKAGWPPGGGRPPTFDEVGMALRKDGVVSHAEAYTTILGNMLTGERSLEEASKAAQQGKP